MPVASSHRQIVSNFRSDRLNRGLEPYPARETADRYRPSKTDRKSEKNSVQEEATARLRMPLDSPAARYDPDTSGKRWPYSFKRIPRWRAYKDPDAVRTKSPILTLPYDGNGNKGGNEKKCALDVDNRPSTRAHPASANISEPLSVRMACRMAHAGPAQHAGTLSLMDIPAKLQALAQDWDRKYGSSAMDVRIVPYESGLTERYVAPPGGQSTDRACQALANPTEVGFDRWSSLPSPQVKSNGATRYGPVQVVVDNLSPAVTIKDVQHVCSDFGRVLTVVPMPRAAPAVRMLVGFELYEGAMAAVRALHCIVADGRQLSVQLVDRPSQA